MARTPAAFASTEILALAYFAPSGCLAYSISISLRKSNTPKTRAETRFECEAIL